MVTIHPGQPKVGLNRRHESMFPAQPPSASSPATHTQHPQHHQGRPRRYPTDHSSPHPHANGQSTTPRQAPPYPSAMRHPTPVVEELDDEPTQPKVTTYHPTQHPQQQQHQQAGSGQRFNATGYNRNLPPGQQPPSRSATSGPPGQFRQGGPPPFSTQGNNRPPHTQGPNGAAPRQPIQRPQGLRVDSEEAMLAKEFQNRMKQGQGHDNVHPSVPGRNGPPPQGHPLNRQTGPRPPARGPPHQGQPSRPTDKTVHPKNKTDAEAVLFDDDDEGRKRKGPTDEDDEFSDIDEGRKTGDEQALVKRGAVDENRVIVKEKAGPIKHFNAPLELNSPFAVAHLLNSIAIRKTRYTVIQDDYKKRQEEAEEEKKHIQWDVVSNVFEVQQQNLEKSMSFYNSVISRFNDLADIKNRNLHEKEDLTDRYRRAGATLSTQWSAGLGFAGGRIGPIRIGRKRREAKKEEENVRAEVAEASCAQSEVEVQVIEEEEEAAEELEVDSEDEEDMRAVDQSL